jgi:hypothetical protein
MWLCHTASAPAKTADPSLRSVPIQNIGPDPKHRDAQNAGARAQMTNCEAGARVLGAGQGPAVLEAASRRKQRDAKACFGVVERGKLGRARRPCRRVRRHSGGCSSNAFACACPSASSGQYICNQENLSLDFARDTISLVGNGGGGGSRTMWAPFRICNLQKTLDAQNAETSRSAVRPHT